MNPVRHHFRPLAVGELLAGAPVYEFAEFYDAKSVLLRYDERDAYLNYGLWDQGADTPNPSASLVAALLAHLPAEGRVLDVGSGLGQPAVDAARRGATVMGTNRNPTQVRLANELARSQRLGDRVEHRAGDAVDIATLWADGAPTAAMSVEALAEMKDADRVLTGIARLLPPGAPFVACDVVRRPPTAVGPMRRAVGWAIERVAGVLFGDAWRTREEYAALLEGAGFGDVRFTSIGDRVFAPTWAHAAGRLGALRASAGRPMLAGFFALANLAGLALLHRWGRVDYVILVGTRRG